ncbi:MAG: N-acetylmuramic acid 6-phosphate etherase [Gaiellaceae bacterium]
MIGWSRLARGGRLVYAGAETSGRLAAVDREAGVIHIRELAVGRDGAVVAVSAGDSTPYVLGALEAAAEAGALRVGVVRARGPEVGRRVDHDVTVVVGPEVSAGSTRLKAGTAQKLVLNTISTVTMVRLGRTYGGLMIGVVQDKAKLRARVRRSLALASGAGGEQIESALAAAGGDAKVALVSQLAGIAPEEARNRLDRAGGSVRVAVGSGRDG